MPESDSIGPYRLLAPLADGSMGQVYLAEHAVTGRKLAVKILRPELFGGERARQRFLLEARAASIEHPNLIQITDAGEVDGRCFIAMRYVRGLDLGRALAAGPIPPQRAAAILSQVAAALDASHARGMVHRDVKPSNILVTSTEDPEGPDHAFLCDFGITKEAAGAALTQTGYAPGTRAYMAPERFRGDPLAGSSDQYALACVAFEALTGRRPFDAETEEALMYQHLNDSPPSASAIVSALGEDVDAVLGKGMAKDPAARYPDCAAFADALSAALASAETDVPSATVPAVGPSSPDAPTTLTPVPSGSRRPSRAASAVLVVGIFLLATAVVGIVATTSRTPGRGTEASSATTPQPSSATSPAEASPSAPPGVDEARLRGPYRLVLSYTDRQGLAGSGNPFWRFWPLTFRPTCASGPCDATVSFDRFGVHASGVLRRQGATYTGTLATRGITICNRADEPGNLEVFLRVATGRQEGPTWRADRLSGSMRYSSVPRACDLASWTANVAATATAGN